MRDAKREVYQFIDSQYRPLPKKSDGTMEDYPKGAADNDIDALRHSYVSGVFTMEYGETTADILGRIVELKNYNFGIKEVPSENMDLWNNAVGRKYGKKSKTRKELFDSLLKALKDGELIIDLKDLRRYKGERSINRLPKSFVIKVKENKNGANIEFFDFRNKRMMTKEQFIESIKAVRYPGYAVRKHSSGEFPYSTRDRFSFNNLG
jgi:hypothetical protein